MAAVLRPRSCAWGGACRVTLHAARCPVSTVAPVGIDPDEKPRGGRRGGGVRSGAAAVDLWQRWFWFWSR